ncbi:MAG: hypothetical protein O8C64_08510 [Candidatus Methanoperedens sp.]|nr:hypothetical protein [Candidatus Methanoperedens sp.]MCZ7406614.1 hypothetical protein [Candidatus Methanoperedens sp.]
MSEVKNLDKANTEKGISALQKALKAKNVTVDAKDLKDAVAAAHKAVVEDCSSCANGWHW